MGVFRDEQVAIQVEREFADLGRDPQHGTLSLSSSPLERGDDFVVASSAVAEPEAAVIAEDGHSATRYQPFGLDVGGEAAGQGLGAVDRIDNPEDA